MSHLKESAVALPSETMCRASDVWFAYRGADWVLKGITLGVETGAFLTILGPSGAGKTTLLKSLAGLLQPQRGAIELLGKTLNGDSGAREKIQHTVGYIPQQLGLVRGSTALENVLLGAVARMPGLLPMFGMFPRHEVERAREHLEMLGIGDKANEKVFRLSGGERQRVAIARTLMQNPRIIFADEFVSDLDLPRAGQVLAAMHDLSQRDKIAFVINLHEIPLVQEIEGEFILLKEGQIVDRGDTQTLSIRHVREVLSSGANEL